MSKQEKKGLVPALRFPEFENEGGWKVKSFDELFTIGNGRDYKHLSSGDVPVYGSGGYMLSVNGHLHDGESVCIGRKGTINNPMLITGKFWTVDTLFYTHSFNGCLPRFIYSIFHNIDWLKHNEAGGVPSLSKTNIGKIKVAIPKLNEQQTIADCLTSIDELITAQTQKLDALKTHKKGLMQQLFPAEGETEPNLRFPEFRNKGEWVKQKNSDLLKKISNPVEVDPSGDYREIGIRSHGKGIFHKKPIKGKDLGNKRVFWVENNAFVVNIVFAWELALANTTDAEIGMIASHRFPMYKARKNKAVINYIKYFFLTNKGQELLWIASPGGAGRNKTLGQKEFEKLEFLIPRLVEEQQKIADCLTSVDELIANQAQKVDALKVHKKGLMQQLFPAMDEMNACQ